MSDQANHLGKFAARTSFAVLLLALLTVAAAPTAQAAASTLLVAQAGSTGGSLGKEEKSVSGAERAVAPKKVPKAVVATRRPRVEAPPAKAMTPPLAIFDGTWAGVSIGPCIPRWTWALQVDGGVMSGGGGTNLSGHINRNGAAAGVMVVFGSNYEFVGHMNESEASGTWVDRGPRGCSGTWVATKS
jgi:hypothetical protein